MEDVEILEPKETWEKDIAVTAAVVSTKVPVQRIVINNQEKVVMGNACAIICPKCRTVIQQFQPGVSEVDIYKSLYTDDEQELSKTIYCKECGQKISILRPMPVVANN